MDILIKNIELKGSLLLTPKAIFKPVEEYDNEKIVQKWEIVKEAEIVPVLHCKDCDNFHEETHLCILRGSWTSEDGFCHKAEVLERTT